MKSTIKIASVVSGSKAVSSLFQSSNKFAIQTWCNGIFVGNDKNIANLVTA